jgi:preprotein translocase subunit SecF
MAATHKPFRYFLPPGSNFEFVKTARVWFTVSMLVVAASIGLLFVNKSVRGDYLNWTIDFKGGTEIIYTFKDKGTGKHVRLPAADIRGALSQAGAKSFDVSEMSFKQELPDGTKEEIFGSLLRTPEYGAVKSDKAAEAIQKIEAQFKDRDILKAQWSGDRLFVRSTKSISDAEMRALLAPLGLEVKPWEAEAALFGHPDEGTGEYNAAYSIWGLDKQYETALEKAFADKNVDVEPVQSYGVGAKAGESLRADGIKSLFYAMALIMLYLAFRFDIRYAPGAVVALLHDAIFVVGAYAITWEEVSLTTVAALLTVIGYSVNDTVIIFDRIRENMHKLKDKKPDRIVNISLNETLSRTILTSVTIFVITLMMNIFGTGLVRNFAFAMNVGIIVGTYSSIFLASPVFLWINNRWYSGAPSRGAVTASVAAEP